MKYSFTITPAENGFTIHYDGDRRKVFEKKEKETLLACAQEVIIFLQEYLDKEVK